MIYFHVAKESPENVKLGLSWDIREQRDLRIVYFMILCKIEIRTESKAVPTACADEKLPDQQVDHSMFWQTLFRFLIDLSIHVAHVTMVLKTKRHVKMIIDGKRTPQTMLAT